MHLVCKCEVKEVSPFIPYAICQKCYNEHKKSCEFENKPYEELNLIQRISASYLVIAHYLMQEYEEMNIDINEISSSVENLAMFIAETKNYTDEITKECLFTYGNSEITTSKYTNKLTFER